MNTTARLLAISVALLLSLPAVAGITVMVETDRPENDFLVLCQWHSNFLNLHGGAKLVKQRGFVVSSGEKVDCGWRLFGGMASVQVLHPSYSVARWHESDECDPDYHRCERDKTVIKPWSREKALAKYVEKNYSKDGNPIGKLIRGLGPGRGGSDFVYFKHYDREKGVDIEYLKQTYNERLIRYWEFYNSVLDKYGASQQKVRPKKAAAVYWKNYDRLMER